MPRATLTLPDTRLAEIRALATRAYPEECCGVLLGRRDDPQGPGRVVEVVPTRNAEEADRRSEGYRVHASEVLAAHRRARARGLVMIGYYHSHPDRPAVPSRRDDREAWPGVSYLILEVSSAGQGEARSWRLASDRSRLVEEPVVVPASREEDRRRANGGSP